MSRELQTGTVFDERYEIKSVAGSGGMATVYRAFHKTLSRDVALKVLHDDRRLSPEDYARLTQEASIVSAVSHPNIAGVNAVGVCDGRPYIAFEFLEGLPLSKYILDKADPIKFDHFIEIFDQVCDGLECAHGQGIVHRDLKPENIFIVSPDSDDELVKIVDFGIAKVLRQGVGVNVQKLTATGAVLGTPLYMSPEQCAGLGVDARSDIYALGCIMYFSIMRKAPFDGDSFFEVMYAHGSMEPPQVVLPDGYDPVLKDVIRKCMAKAAADRYSSVKELRADLDSLSHGKLVRARVVKEPATKSPKRDPRKRSILIGAIALSILLGTGTMLFMSNPTVKKNAIFSKLRSEWKANSYDETLKQVKAAYESGDADLAKGIARQASSAAFKHPTAEAAHGLLELSRLIKQHDTGFEARRWKQKTDRVLRFMPVDEWRKRQAIEALRAVAAGDDKDEKVVAGDLINWTKWQIATRDFATQRAILDYVEKTYSGKISYTTFETLQGDMRNNSPGIFGEQWLSGDLTDAEHTIRFCFDRVQEDSLAEGPSAPYSSQTMRAGLSLCGVLAAIGHSQQNGQVLESLLYDPRCTTDWERIPLMVAYAEERFTTGHEDVAVEYLERAEAKVDSFGKKFPAIPLVYLGVIGDGYLSLGQRDKAMQVYQKLLDSERAYIERPEEKDYGHGKFKYSLAHAYLMLGQRDKAIKEITEAVELEKNLDGTHAKDTTRSPYMLWLHCTGAEEQTFSQLDDAKPKVQNKVRQLFAFAAFHAFGGRFDIAGPALHQIAMLLQQHGLEKNYVDAYRAGIACGTLGGYDELAIDCLKLTLAKSNSQATRIEAKMLLAAIYAREGKYSEAKALYGELVPDIQNDEQRWRLVRSMILCGYHSKDWKYVCDNFPMMRELENKVAPKYTHASYRAFQEVYAFALRQDNRDSEADTQVDELEALIGPDGNKNGKDSAH